MKLAQWWFNNGRKHWILGCWSSTLKSSCRRRYTIYQVLYEIVEVRTDNPRHHDPPEHESTYHWWWALRRMQLAKGAEIETSRVLNPGCTVEELPYALKRPSMKTRTIRKSSRWHSKQSGHESSKRWNWQAVQVLHVSNIHNHRAQTVQCLWI